MKSSRVFNWSTGPENFSNSKIITIVIEQKLVIGSLKKRLLLFTINNHIISVNYLSSRGGHTSCGLWGEYGDFNVRKRNGKTKHKICRNILVIVNSNRRILIGNNWV